MTYIIAEIGNSHEGDFGKAKELIAAAAECGVDCAKFQIFDAAMLVHPSLPSRVGEGTQLGRMRNLMFDRDKWGLLKECAHEHGLEFGASVFDVETMKWAAPMLDFVKIASGDADQLELINFVPADKKSAISTGCTLPIDLAPNMVVMHCVSMYPTPTEMASLDRIDDLKAAYGEMVGYSDHTQGYHACAIAAAKGVKMIEKHFAVDWPREDGDYSHAAGPTVMSMLVNTVREIDKMCQIRYNPDPDAVKSLMRGAYAHKDIVEGQRMTRNDIIMLRPATGVTLEDVLGKTANRAYKRLEAIDAV